MTKTYSYPRIVGAVIWQGILLGGGLGAGIGALVGISISPFIGALVGAALGGGVGLVAGTLDGLFLSGVTWLCRPIYTPEKFAKFTAIGSALLTFIIGVIGFGLFFALQFINPLNLAFAAIAGLTSAWATYRVAKNVAASDLSTKTAYSIQ